MIKKYFAFSLSINVLLFGCLLVASAYRPSVVSYVGNKEHSLAFSRKQLERIPHSLKHDGVLIEHKALAFYSGLDEEEFNQSLVFKLEINKDSGLKPASFWLYDEQIVFSDEFIETSTVKEIVECRHDYIPQFFEISDSISAVVRLVDTNGSSYFLKISDLEVVDILDPAFIQS